MQSDIACFPAAIDGRLFHSKVLFVISEAATDENDEQLSERMLLIYYLFRKRLK